MKKLEKSEMKHLMGGVEAPPPDGDGSSGDSCGGTYTNSDNLRVYIPMSRAQAHAWAASDGPGGKGWCCASCSSLIRVIGV